MSRTVAILVNYHCADDTLRCIESVLEGSSKPTVVVVDNSTAESQRAALEASLSAFPDVKLIVSPSNVGFSRGNNLGMRWALSNARCEFLFILNCDAVVKPDTPSRLEAALDAYPDAGISCPRIVMMENPDVLWNGGAEINWFKGSVQAPGFGGPADGGLALTPRNVTFASGCAMLIRRSALEQVGGFDPRYFLYEEDVEFCLRMHETGFTIRYVPEALVLHKCQGSLRAEGQEFFPIHDPRNPRLPFLVYHITRNRLLTMHRHARGRNALRFWCCFPLYWSAKCLWFGLHGRWSAIWSVAKGARAFSEARNAPFVDRFTQE